MAVEEREAQSCELPCSVLVLAGERMLGRIFFLNHLLNARLVLHRTGDCQLGRVVVVLKDLLVIIRIPVDEHAADDAQFFGLIFGDDTGGDRICNSLGNGVLGWAEHLDGLFCAFDRNFRNHDGSWFDRQIGG